MKLPNEVMQNISRQISILKRETGINISFTVDNLNQKTTAHITEAHRNNSIGAVNKVYFYTISAGNQGWWGINKNVLQRLQRWVSNPNVEAYIVVVDKSAYGNINNIKLHNCTSNVRCSLCQNNPCNELKCLIFDVNTIQQQLKLSETDTAYQFALSHLKGYEFMPLIQAISERIDASII
ncbi:MAG: hypothetical protein K2N27_11285 [Ruminococcus sp.]|nr:hypothetical protein [Ruminococcus sp.]